MYNDEQIDVMQWRWNDWMLHSNDASADRMDWFENRENDDEEDGDLREPIRVLGYVYYNRLQPQSSRKFGAGAGVRKDVNDVDAIMWFFG